MISPTGSYPTFESDNRGNGGVQPLNAGEMQTTSMPLELEDPEGDVHKEDIKQLDNVLDSLTNAE